ncbi:hypothetical protein [Trichocoleus sp. DQ-U1]|uniref:hypothetical protein n=1 Tax=Trichocoleus sp. DQ-U1 TaxID=2933926 RepID=UPI003298838A
MITTNQYIFAVLADFVQTSNIGVPISDKNQRYIGTDTEEKEWLKNLKILVEQPILPNFKTAAFEFESNKYFVAIGWHTHKISDELLQIIELNAGIFTALVSELKVIVNQNASPYDIANEIFYESEQEKIKYGFSQVAKFFEPIYVYQIQDNSPFINQDDIDIISLSGFYAIKNRQIISLNFSGSTLSRFEKLFIEGSKNIPCENLLLSLVSVSWKYTFLDIYRCIERLFCISALEDFHKNLKIGDSLLKFSADIENYIGWRPKENESLNKLIENSPEEAIHLFREVKVSIDGQEEGKYGELIYRVRNSIVHFRPANEGIKLDDENWDKLINSSLLVIDYWYNKYDKQLKI